MCLMCTRRLHFEVEVVVMEKEVLQYVFNVHQKASFRQKSDKHMML